MSQLENRLQTVRVVCMWLQEDPIQKQNQWNRPGLKWLTFRHTTFWGNQLISESVSWGCARLTRVTSQQSSVWFSVIQLFVSLGLYVAAGPATETTAAYFTPECRDALDISLYSAPIQDHLSVHRTRQQSMTFENFLRVNNWISQGSEQQRHRKSCFAAVLTKSIFIIVSLIVGIDQLRRWSPVGVGSHFSAWSLKSWPIGHVQKKEPSLFTHWASPHTRLSSSHSFRSEEKKKHG